ncbi:cytochrome P450 [Sulfitobacter sp. 20_GPM-1509m]|uniref:cytochrome P450 n=1 Tax=Sulfitobacter sp. 20_GPM-1509m TaxID=1380367 RepID=UPI00068591EA|nr:cytochrome P450 [Sulfitobacter sp. 20_GPM-1509m]
MNEVPTIPATALKRNAHAAFQTVRASHPIARLEAGGYIVLRHKDVNRLSKDKRLQATGTAIPQQAGITEGALFDIFQHGMLTANDATHAQRRAPLSRAMTILALDSFRLEVRRAATTLIKEFRSRGRLELGREYADKLPVHTLAWLLGVSDDEFPSFIEKIYEMNAFFRPDVTDEAVKKAEAACHKVRCYLEHLIDRERLAQGESFLARYLALSDADSRLTRVEIAMQLIQMIIGGTESVRTSILAQTSYLLSNPEQWKAVCNDSNLVPAAVAEGMRIEPGIAGIARLSVEDIDVDGWTLPAGQLVVLSAMSALRDETVFRDGDSFDISRENSALSRLAFGGGAHQCIAEAFGRCQLEEALRALTTQLPELVLETAPQFHGHIFVRSTTDCNVSW